MKPIKVLVVDDSAFMRVLIGDFLRKDKRIDNRIETARNGIEAVDKTIKLKPDVVVLDVIMPKMDGLTALREIMKKAPTPVILLSALSPDQISKAMRGFETGAVDVLQKPSERTDDSLEELRRMLVSRIIAAARVDVRILKPSIAKPLPTLVAIPGVRPKALTQKLIVIGSSTGGPRALSILLPQFPKVTPPILLVQHMPAGFTTAFAERLNTLCRIQVEEARDGTRLEPSKALLAPGGYHIEVKGRPGNKNAHVKLSKTPPVNHLRPSVDVTMASAADIYRDGVLGVILTGMGSDGKDGIKRIKEKGGMAIAEDPSTCVVAGMPQAIIKENLPDSIKPLNNIAVEIRRMDWF